MFRPWGGDFRRLHAAGGKTEKLPAKSIPPETNSRHAGTTLRACSIRMRLSHRCGQLSIIS